MTLVIRRGARASMNSLNLKTVLVTYLLLVPLVLTPLWYAMNVEKNPMHKNIVALTSQEQKVFKRNYNNPLYVPKRLETRVSLQTDYEDFIDGMCPKGMSQEEIKSQIMRENDVSGHFIEFSDGRFKFVRVWCDYAF